MTSTQPLEPYPTQPVEGQPAGGEGATTPLPPPPPAPSKPSVDNRAFTYGSSPYSPSSVPGPYSQYANFSPTMQLAPGSPCGFPPSQFPCQPGQMSPFGPMYGQSMQQPFQGMPFPGFPGLPAGPGYPYNPQGRQLKKGKTYKGDGINICIADSALKPQCPEQKVEQCSCCRPTKPKCKPKKKVQQQPVCLLHDYCVLKRLREGCKDFETLGRPPQKRKTVYKVIYECVNKNKRKRKPTPGICKCNEEEKQEKNASIILAKLQALCLMYKFCKMVALREEEDKKSVTLTSCVCVSRKSVEKKDKGKEEKDTIEKDKDREEKDKKEKKPKEKKEKGKDMVKEGKGKKTTGTEEGKDKEKQVNNESKPAKTQEKKEQKQKDVEKKNETNPTPADPTQPQITDTEATGQVQPIADVEEPVEPVPPEEGNQPEGGNQPEDENQEQQP